MSGTEVRPDLVCLRTGIVNVYFYGLPGAGDRGWVLIDAGLHGFAGRIRRAAAKRFGRHARPAAIVLTHGHFDHIADSAKIANRTGATVVSNYEITTWLAKQHGVKNTVGGNLGGGASLPFGRVKLTLAFHSSSLPDGSNGGNPCGFLVTLTSGEKLYFACDTGLFGDMALRRQREEVIVVVAAETAPLQRHDGGQLCRCQGLVDVHSDNSPLLVVGSGRAPTR